jgi:hypothetical protein
MNKSSRFWGWLLLSATVSAGCTGTSGRVASKDDLLPRIRVPRVGRPNRPVSPAVATKGGQRMAPAHSLLRASAPREQAAGAPYPSYGHLLPPVGVLGLVAKERSTLDRSSTRASVTANPAAAAEEPVRPAAAIAPLLGPPPPATLTSRSSVVETPVVTPPSSPKDPDSPASPVPAPEHLPTGPYGHAEDYSWLRGKIDRPYSGGTKLRFCDACEEERHGGCVFLTSNAALGALKDGALVEVRGRLLDSQGPSQRGESIYSYPAYHVDSLRVLRTPE